jgi:hypothetical protein
VAAYVKYEPFIEGMWNKLFDLFGTTDTVKAVLHSDAPTVATDDELADLTQVSGTGYTGGAGGGDDTQNDSTRTGGTVTVTAVDHTWTATAADWVAARYVSWHDDTSTTDRLICSWDYGSNFTLGNGETFTVDYGASVHTSA